jgi:subtilisin-like proprotein convertase family protein
MLTLTVQAGIYNGSFSDGTIRDGNPTGWANTVVVNETLPYVGHVNVNMNVSSGYNGDLYAYLSHGGVLVPLLNRVGTGISGTSEPQFSFGFSTSGFNNITLDDNATLGSIHTVEFPQANQSYQPDHYSGGNSLVNFNGLTANGTWTLFFADLSGGEISTVQGWSLNVTASTVPEPVNVALVVFGGAFGLVTLVRSRKLQNLFRRAVAH